MLTIYIDPEVRTSRVLQEALLDEKSRVDVKWIKSHDFTNDSFYGVTKICLEDANKEVKTMYKAEFHFNRKTIFLGMYSSTTEAARAFDRAALAKIGPHAKINFHLSNYTEEGGTNTVSLLGVKRVKESLQGSTGNAASKKSLDQKAINGHYTAAALGEHDQKHNPKPIKKKKKIHKMRVPRIVKHSSPYPFHKLTIPPNLLGKCVHITECFAIFHRIFDFPRVDLMSLVSALFLHSVNDKNKTVKCINEDGKLCQSSNANVDYDAHILAQMHFASTSSF